MLRTILEWIWGMIVLMGLIGLAMFSIYVIILSIALIVTHWIEIMAFGIMCALLVLIISIVKYIWEVLTDEER